MGTVSAEGKKVIRAQQKHQIKLQPYGSSSLSINSAISSKFNGKKLALPSLSTIKMVATSAKDEIVDIFESIVYAETGEERLENTIDIMKRHKNVIAVVGGGLVLKKILGYKR